MNDSTSVVSFNVGGHQFTTARETLLKEANSRLALVARGVLNSLKDDRGAILVDRDPKYFQAILNFLRDGWCLLPGSAQERRELLQEVRFYQLSGFEGWLRTQEILADAGGYNAQEYVAMESPRPRALHPGQHASTMPSSPYSATGPAATLTAGAAQGWPPAGATASAATFSGLSPQHHQHYGHTHTHSLNLGSTLGRTSPARSAAPPPTASPGGGGGMTGTWGGGGGGGQGGVIASLREAFLAATGPQRPAPHTAAYSLPSGPEDGSASWTSKYLRGNEGLRGLVNTLLELAFVAPHRSLHGGRSHLSISVACDHGRESSLVGNKEDQMRAKLLELRVRGAQGWAFEVTLRPGSDAVLWDKYGNVAAAVQDSWFVLGAVLKDQFGVVMEEEAAARPACAACRRTCLAVTLNKIY